LRLSSRCLFSGSSVRFCASLNSRRLARHLRQKLGLRLAPAGSPTVSQSPSTPCSTGSEGSISCNQWNFVINT
jgi:hypothetical protein